MARKQKERRPSALEMTVSALVTQVQELIANDAHHASSGVRRVSARIDDLKHQVESALDLVKFRCEFCGYPGQIPVVLLRFGGPLWCGGCGAEQKGDFRALLLSRVGRGGESPAQDRCNAKQMQPTE